MTDNSTPDPFEDLRQLVLESGPNRHDMAIVAIAACIANGIDTSKAILAIAAELNLDPQHVGIILRSDRGTDPARHRWRRDATGHYHLLD